MKRLSVLLLTAILFSSGAFAQDYYPLVQENNEWNVLYVYNDLNVYPPDTIYYTQTYKIDGDTLIEEQIYQKVYIKEEDMENWEYQTSLREENQKVWKFSKYSNEELLIYDFQVEVTDTLSYLPQSAVVDSIKYMEIIGEQRKHIFLSYLNTPCTELWVEGIGSNYGILSSGEGMSLGSWTWLLCYWQDEELVYSNPDFEGCWMTNVGLEEARERQIRIYPNPAKDYLRIENTGNNRIREISISDITGREIMVIKECNRPINISSLASGVYIVKVIYSGSEITRKLVVE